ncbi:MAG: OB-fold nucleic acid binding domain-containing protein, partial [Chloroflexi bacterium]|nr:OB-fold nucleic acid binding domain-containing protein [Chloroflexota bacterium]
LDRFGSRKSMLDQLDRIVSVAQQSTRTAAAGKVSMFGMIEETAPTIFSIPPAQHDPATLKQCYTWERELLGVYFGQHPLNGLAHRLRERNVIATSEFTEDITGSKVTVGGLLIATRTVTTRSGQSMLYATLEDLSGTVEVTVFPRVFDATRDVWETDRILLIQGKLEQRGEGFQIMCETVQQYAEDDQISMHHLCITVPPLQDPVSDRLRLENVAKALRNAKGSDTVEVRVRTSIGTVRLDTSTLRTQWTPELEERIRQLLGREAITVSIFQPAILAVAS